MDVPPFSITSVIENEEKQKSHFYLRALIVPGWIYSQLP
jgi:hypothetical protein